MNDFIQRYYEIDSWVPMFFLIMGIMSALAFIFSGFPQAIKSIKEGHANGVAKLTAWAWWIGEIGGLAYAGYFYPDDFVLLGNYSINSIVVFIVLWYCYFGRNSK